VSETTLSVTRGTPTPEELAALTVVLASLGGSAPAPKPQRSLWATPRLRAAHQAGPGAWRASGLPR